MPTIPTPYDDRINAFQRRLNKQGKNPPQPPFWSAEFETTQSRLRRDLAESQAQLAGRGLTLEQQYGINDKSNPFSQARNLERNWQAQKQRTTNSFASQGLFYSGAHSRGVSADQMDHNRDLDAMSRAYQAERGDITQDRLAARRAYDEGMAAAEAKRLEAALNAPVDPDEAPPTPDDIAPEFDNPNRQRPGDRDRYAKNLKKRMKKRGKDRG